MIEILYKSARDRKNMKGSQVHTISDRQIELWERLYPGVDVEEEIKRVKDLFESNVLHRNSHKGIDKCINRHLSEVDASNKSK